jgi:hypothetical protein
MRVRDGDPGDAAKPVQQIGRGLVDQADAIPQDIARRRLHKQRALTDRKLRRHPDAEQPRLEPAEAVAMATL